MRMVIDRTVNRTRRRPAAILPPLVICGSAVLLFAMLRAVLYRLVMVPYCCVIKGLYSGWRALVTGLCCVTGERAKLGRIFVIINTTNRVGCDARLWGGRPGESG